MNETTERSKKLVVWNPRSVHLTDINPQSGRTSFDEREQANLVAAFMTGHLPGNVFEYFVRAIATITLPYDQITHENVNAVADRVRIAIERMAEAQQ